jgi:hypothetical protein
MWSRWTAPGTRHGRGASVADPQFAAFIGLAQHYSFSLGLAIVAGAIPPPTDPTFTLFPWQSPVVYLFRHTFVVFHDGSPVALLTRVVDFLSFVRSVARP